MTAAKSESKGKAKAKAQVKAKTKSDALPAEDKVEAKAPPPRPEPRVVLPNQEEIRRMATAVSHHGQSLSRDLNKFPVLEDQKDVYEARFAAIAKFCEEAISKLK